MIANPPFAASRASERRPTARERQYDRLEQPAWRLPGIGNRILSAIWRIFHICSSQPTPKLGIRCSTNAGARPPPQWKAVLHRRPDG